MGYKYERIIKLGSSPICRGKTVHDCIDSFQEFLVRLAWGWGRTEWPPKPCTNTSRLENGNRTIAELILSVRYPKPSN